MSKDTEKSVLDSVLSEVIQNDEPASQADTKSDTSVKADEQNWWAEKETEVAPLDNSLFEEPEVQKPTQVTEEQKALDREKVKQATIQKSLERVIDDDWAINQDEYVKLPNWIKKEIDNQLSDQEVQDDQPLTREWVKQVLQEERDLERFESLKRDIVEWQKLSRQQQEQLAQEYKDLRANWVSKIVALEKASKIIWVNYDLAQKSKDIWYQRAISWFPSETVQPTKETPLNQKPLKEMTNDEVITFMRSLKK